MTLLSFRWGIDGCQAKNCNQTIAELINTPLDSDITGKEVLIVFLAVTIFGMLVSMITVIRRLQRSIEDWRRAIPCPDRIKVNGLFSAEMPLESLLASVSDQQLFLGLGYLSGILGNGICNRLTFEVDILLSLMLITCSVQTISALGMREFWMNPVIAFIRVVLSGFLFYETSTTLKSRDDEPYIPTTRPSADASVSMKQAMLGPIYCTTENIVDKSRHTEMWKQSWPSSYQCYVLISIYLTVILSKPTALAFQRLVQHMQKSTEKELKQYSERSALCKKFSDLSSVIHSGSLIGGLTLAIYIGATTLSETLQLRDWVVNEYGEDTPKATAHHLGSQLVIFSVWPLGFAFVHVVTEKLARLAKRRKNQELNSTDDDERASSTDQSISTYRKAQSATPNTVSAESGASTPKPNLAGPLNVGDGRTCVCIACESNAVLPALKPQPGPGRRGPCSDADRLSMVSYMTVDNEDHCLMAPRQPQDSQNTPTNMTATASTLVNSSTTALPSIQTNYHLLPPSSASLPILTNPVFDSESRLEMGLGIHGHTFTDSIPPTGETETVILGYGGPVEQNRDYRSC